MVQEAVARVVEVAPDDRHRHQRGHHRREVDGAEQLRAARQLGVDQQRRGQRHRAPTAAPPSDNEVQRVPERVPELAVGEEAARSCLSPTKRAVARRADRVDVEVGEARAAARATTGITKKRRSERQRRGQEEPGRARLPPFEHVRHRRLLARRRAASFQQPAALLQDAVHLAVERGQRLSGSARAPDRRLRPVHQSGSRSAPTPGSWASPPRAGAARGRRAPGDRSRAARVAHASRRAGRSPVSS